MSDVQRTDHDQTADHDRLRLFSFQVYSQLRGRGDRRDDPPRRPPRPVSGARHRRRADDDVRARVRDRAPRAVGARVGRTTRPRPGSSSCTPATGGDRRPVLALARGAGRAGHARASSVRDGAVPPPAPDDAGAGAHARRASAPGCGHDYDSHGPEGAEGIERSFEPWMSANLLRKVLPGDGRRGRAARAPGPGRRRRLWRRQRRACMLAEAFPAVDVRRLRHLAARARPGRSEAGRLRARRTRASPTRATNRCPTTTASTSSRRSTASTTCRTRRR